MAFGMGQSKTGNPRSRINPSAADALSEYLGPLSFGAKRAPQEPTTETRLRSRGKASQAPSIAKIYGQMAAVALFSFSKKPTAVVFALPIVGCI